MVTQSALDAAKTVEQAAQARFDTGLLDQTRTAPAHNRVRNSNFDVQASLARRSDARLLSWEHRSSADCVAQSGRSARAKPSESSDADSVGELITKALSNAGSGREAANVAQEQGILKIRAEVLSEVTLDATFRNRAGRQHRELELLRRRRPNPGRFPPR